MRILQTNTTHKLRPCAPARTLLPTVQTARPAPVPVGAASSKKGVFDPDLACGQETYLVRMALLWLASVLCPTRLLACVDDIFQRPAYLQTLMLFPCWHFIIGHQSALKQGFTVPRWQL